MKFTELSLDERAMRGIEDAGFTDCTPVQEETFKYTMEGKDVLVQSQTGTGKTAAFLITTFQNFLSGARTGKSLVVVPTRELAVQIEEEAQLLGGHTGMRMVSVYGGVGYNKQEELLATGVDLIIGTPGRLLDFGKSGKIKFEEVQNLVIDEADRMFDMGFYPDIRMMMKKMPPVGERQTMLFSATLSTRVRNLAWEYMDNPGEIEICPENLTVDLIEQELYHVTKQEKLPLLLGLFKRDSPDNCLIFCNTKYMAVELAWRLTENGYKCQYLMGDLPQKKRLQVIERMKAGEIQFLVATDVAARGLHVDDLNMVVNYDIPEDFENYVHRIGRTARAGKTGKAVTMACEKFVYGLEAIEDYIKMKIPVQWADESLFAEDVTKGKSFVNPDKDYIRRDNDRGGRGGRDGRSGERPRRDGRNQSGAGQGPAPEQKPLRSYASTKKPGADAPEQDRIAYYKKKYGEDFQNDGSSHKSDSSQKSDSTQKGSSSQKSRSTQKGSPAKRSDRSSGKARSEKRPAQNGASPQGQKKLNSYSKNYKAPASSKKHQGKKSKGKNYQSKKSQPQKQKGILGRFLGMFKKESK